jgi:hypothetical protein
MSKFIESIFKQHQEFGASPECWEKVKKVDEKIYLERFKRDEEKIAKNYGADIVKRAKEYANDHFSKAKISKMNTEEKVEALLGDPNEKDTMKALESRLGRDLKGKAKGRIHLSVEDEIGELQWDDDGEIIGEIKPYKNDSVGRWYGDEEAMKMPLEDLEGILPRTKE